MLVSNVARQLLGVDLMHPRLGHHLAGSPLLQMVDAVAGALDTDSDGAVSRQEIKAYIRLVCKIRIMLEVVHTVSDVDTNAKYDMLHGDLDRDGLDVNEIFHMHHHDDPYDASIHPTDLGFTFSDINGDGKVAGFLDLPRQHAR